MKPRIVRGLKSFDRRKIAETLSLLEKRASRGLAVAEKSFSTQSLAKVVCVTGPAGVGKSSFISAYIDLFGSSERIAWLACDPSSAVSGGSLLGDRIRLGEEKGVTAFIRSLATRSDKPYALAVRDMAIFLEPYFDRIFVETTGIGQGQRDVLSLAPLTLLLVQPETGDDVQSMKAGLLEEADIVVVHKADLPGAPNLAKDLRLARETRSQKNSSDVNRLVVEVSSSRHLGFEDLRQKIINLQSESSFVDRLTPLHQRHGRELYLARKETQLERDFRRLWLKARENPYAFAKIQER